MALCRSFLHFNSPLQRIHTATLLFPNCPPRLQNSLRCHSQLLFRHYHRHPWTAHQKIFAASRLDIPDSWQMPQGGIDESEDPRNAVIRELREEETGVTSADIIAEDEEVNLLGDGTEKAEFGQWSWMSPQEIVDHVSLLSDPMETAVDFKKPVYREVLKVFSPYL
ncbi:hypothetical protein DH2020_030320 [Rehmannia glutinosa]|uniref:Nudix hydrolase domain-containing protein n=1 Tax=Rehmannia glutinosa TaxID=99300 RepID=A0ABR0VLX3_REHGL